MSRTHISSSIMNRIRVFESTVDSQLISDDSSSSIGFRGSQTCNKADNCGTNSYSIWDGRTAKTMSSSPPPPQSGVQTDAEGLILPKKLINPCLKSTEHKELHRELKFNNKVGKNVLNQKSELQRAYEKQKERQQIHQTHDHSPTDDLKSELNRAIMERTHKSEHTRSQDKDLDEDDKQYVNPEYLNARAKLRTGQRPDMK